MECCLGVPRAPGTSEAVFCVVQVDGYAVCLFSFVNSFVEAVFSIFSTFGCLQASVDIVYVRKVVGNVFADVLGVC